MKLTASPFNSVTGDLLPVYRDAYLRGDLSLENTRLVDAYLKDDTNSGTQTWQRFHAMQQDGEQLHPVGWMQRQLNLMQTSPQRVRRQAMAAVAGLALVGGAVFAGTGATPATVGGGDDAPLAVTSTLRMSTLRGKILDENGHPLVGATVFEKGSRRGVSTDANGEYALAVPAGRPTTLAYGYGGYADDELRLNTNSSGQALDNVTLVPNTEAPAKATRKARRWFLF